MFYIHDYTVFPSLYDRSGDNKAFFNAFVVTRLIWLDTTALGPLSTFFWDRYEEDFKHVVLKLLSDYKV